MKYFFLAASIFFSCLRAIPPMKELLELGFETFAQMESLGLEDDLEDLTQIIPSVHFKGKEQLELLVDVVKGFHKTGLISLPPNLSVSQVEGLVWAASFFQVKCFCEIFISATKNILKYHSREKIKASIPYLGSSSKVKRDGALMALRNLSMLAYSSIEGLDFSHTHLRVKATKTTGKNQLQNIMKILDAYKFQLLHISIEDIEVDAFLLASLIRNSPNLETLHLHNNNLEKSISKLPLQKLESLKVLRLTSNQITIKDIENVIDLFTNPNNKIEHLDLSDNLLKTKVIVPAKTVYTARAAYTTDERITFYDLFTDSVSLKNLKVLNLTGCFFYPDTIDILEPVLKMNPQLEQLILSGNSKKPFNCSIMDAFAAMKSLQVLSLSEFTFKNLKNFLSVASKLPLKRLSFSHKNFNSTEDFFVFPETLESLEITSGELPSGFFDSLINSTESGKLHLKEINISNCQFTSNELNGFKTFLRSKKSSIHTLNLAFNDSRLSELEATLYKMPKLENLTIGANIEYFPALKEARSLSLDSLTILGEVEGVLVEACAAKFKSVNQVIAADLITEKKKYPLSRLKNAIMKVLEY